MRYNIKIPCHLYSYEWLSQPHLLQDASFPHCSRMPVLLLVFPHLWQNEAFCILLHERVCPSCNTTHYLNYCSLESSYWLYIFHPVFLNFKQIWAFLGSLCLLLGFRSHTSRYNKYPTQIAAPLNLLKLSQWTLTAFPQLYNVFHYQQGTPSFLIIFFHVVFIIWRYIFF